MPASYRIHVPERLIRMRAWGVFSNADLRDYYHRLTADSAFDPTYRHLASLDDVTRFDVAAEVVAETASWPVFSAGTRRAVVALSDVAFGLSRMFSTHAERVGQNVQIFRTELDALLWLDSPTDSRGALDTPSGSRASGLGVA